jgi:hypothetical protein
MGKYDSIILTLEEKLILIAKENNSLSKQAQYAIPLCVEALDELKFIINKSGFKSKQEEINFFKKYKPSINSKLIYFIQLLNIESGKPNSSEKKLKKHFTTHLKTIDKFKADNISFYKYYESDEIFLDEKYFIRNSSNLHLILDVNTFNYYDIAFNTSHDQKVAQIIANTLLIKYIHNQLNKVEPNLFSEIEPSGKKLKWTDSKNSLIELIYALQASGSLNEGKADVKEIASYFEQCFNIELGDLYRNYHDLKYRKINRTKYLDELKNHLIKRMDTMDEKLN